MPKKLKKKSNSKQKNQFQSLSERLLELYNQNENDPVVLGKIRDELVRMKQKQEVVETDPLLEEVLW